MIFVVSAWPAPRSAKSWTSSIRQCFTIGPGTHKVENVTHRPAAPFRDADQPLDAECVVIGLRWTHGTPPKHQGHVRYWHSQIATMSAARWTGHAQCRKIAPCRAIYFSTRATDVLMSELKCRDIRLQNPALTLDLPI
jgi:hypothetical protein